MCLLVIERSVKSKRQTQHRLTEEMEPLKAGRHRMLHSTLHPHSTMVASRTPSIFRPEEQDGTRHKNIFFFKSFAKETFKRKIQMRLQSGESQHISFSRSPPTDFQNPGGNKLQSLEHSSRIHFPNSHPLKKPLNIIEQKLSKKCKSYS